MPACRERVGRASRCERLEARTLLSGGFRFTYDGLYGEDTDAIRPAVLAAAGRWEAILTADIPDVPAGPWGGAVDDVRLSISSLPIDGPGHVLAYAEPRYRREPNNTGLPITGGITIDLDDAANPKLVDILTHEIGHVLGIGASWVQFVTDFGGPNPQYFGAAALTEYRSLAGDLGLGSIPVENTGNPGTRDVHWREATFFNELMTGFLNSSVANPLSRVSAAALIDLGWPGVSLEGTQPYNLPGGNPIPIVAALTASAPTTGTGRPFTLSATNVTDLGRASDGAGAGVASVRFYRESNGIAGLQATGNVTNSDTLISSDTAADYAATVDATGLAPGNYTFYAQPTDVLGATGGTVAVDHTIVLPPPTPATPILDASSDHGPRNDDGITNVARPVLRGTIAGAQVGTFVDIFADGLAIGTAAVTSGTWLLVPTNPLADGPHAITAVARAGGVTSGASAVLMIFIDTFSPHATPRFDSLTRFGLAIDFDEDVSASLAADNVIIVNATTGTPATAILGPASSTSAFFALSPLTLSAGDYFATLKASGVTDVAGNSPAADTTVTFTYLPGDVNHSRTVDLADLVILAQHYGRAGNALDGDIDYSGVVNFSDLVLLARNYGATLDPPALIQTESAAKPASKRAPRPSIAIIG